jgi:hypothetical protein
MHSILILKHIILNWTKNFAQPELEEQLSLLIRHVFMVCNALKTYISFNIS